MTAQWGRFLLDKFIGLRAQLLKRHRKAPKWVFEATGCRWNPVNLEESDPAEACSCVVTDEGHATLDGSGRTELRMATTSPNKAPMPALLAGIGAIGGVTFRGRNHGERAGVTKRVEFRTDFFKEENRAFLCLFMHVNAPSSPDLNPTENLWSLFKRDTCEGGRQFSGILTSRNEIGSVHNPRTQFRFPPVNSASTASQETPDSQDSQHGVFGNSAYEGMQPTFGKVQVPGTSKGNYN